MVMWTGEYDQQQVVPLLMCGRLRTFLLVGATEGPTQVYYLSTEFLTVQWPLGKTQPRSTYSVRSVIG